MHVNLLYCLHRSHIACYMPHSLLPPPGGEGGWEGEGEREEGLGGEQRCSEVHSATWRPTASFRQPIGGWEKQTLALRLVSRSQELIVLSMAVSLCRLAGLKPIILPPFFVQTSFLQQTPHTLTHAHPHMRTNLLLDSPRMSQETEGVWESEDLTLIAMRRL